MDAADSSTDLKSAGASKPDDINRRIVANLNESVAESNHRQIPLEQVFAEQMAQAKSAKKTDGDL